MTTYNFAELPEFDRMCVIKAITEYREANGNPSVDGSDLDITLTVDGTEVDFVDFCRRIVDGINHNLNQRAKQLAIDVLREKEAQIRDTIEAIEWEIKHD